MHGSVDWAREWLASLAWVGELLGWTTAGFVLVAWVLMRVTRWGRQFRRLALAYFVPGKDRGSWPPLLMVLLMLALAVAKVRISVLVSYASSGLYTAMQELDPRAFGRYLGVFGVLAVISVALVLLTFFVERAFVIRWRVWLTNRMLDDWLSGSAYHRNRFLDAPVDNPDQRIQEDIDTFTLKSQSLALGAVRSTVSLVSFTVILWGLSGPLTVGGFEIPRAMTFITYVYVVVVSVAAFRVGRPLIRLSFWNERLAASFRYGLIRVRENSEPIAFYHGEKAEREHLGTRFSAVINNAWALVYRGLKLTGLNTGASQLAVVLPILIQAPRFFSGAIKLGDLQQTAQAFSEVHDSLSFFRDSYDGFAAYRAVLDRLTGLLDANHAARGLPALTHTERREGLRIRDLTVNRPDGQTLIADLSMDVAVGETLLVKGQSGSGKTTLLRSLANLWPHAHGQLSGPPDEHAFFLPQQPYVPLGGLRAALAYPRHPDTVNDTSARAVLHQVQLGHLAEDIDTDSDWAHTLSPGEQQRLGLARLLLTRPRIAFLDEATSALDEGLEHALYTLIRDQLPDCILISVGHRATLDNIHGRQLLLQGYGSWNLVAPVRQP